MNPSIEFSEYRIFFEQEFTWLNGYERNVRRFAEKAALIDARTGEALCYREFDCRANRLANALAARGVAAGDTALYILSNSFEFALMYVAPQKLGAVNSPLNFNFAPGEIACILEHDHPAAFVYGAEYAEAANRALEISAWQPKVILACGAENVPAGQEDFQTFLSGGSAAEPLRTRPANMYDETTRLFTSGTTGMPKEVPLLSANELLSAHDVMMHFPLSDSDVTMNLTPWFHRGGLHSGGLTPTLYAGGTCVIVRGFSAGVCLDAVEKYGVSFMIGVPAIVRTLAARQERHPAKLDGLKGIVLMGSPLEREDCLYFQRVLTPRIFNGYGTTETFWNSFLRPADLPKMAGSAGRACTDDEVRVVRADGEKRAEPEDTVPADSTSVGEIIIHAPMKSTLCYADNAEMTKKKFYRGWLYTGDLGVWDAQGYVSINGRRDDMIVCKGENIYPAQIEEVLCRCPGVRDCIVTGVPDGTRGQAVAAYVIAEGELTAAELNAYCVGSPDLSGYKCPRYYRFVDELPYTPTGKKRHVQMRLQAEQDLQNNLLERP